jgi:hypothetical protein
VENPEPSNAKSTWISEGLLIACAPVTAYLLTLSYISGYSSYFNIPMEFLSLNITTLFAVGGNVVSVGLFAYVFFLTLFLLWPHSDSPILKRALIIFPFAAVLFIKVMFFGKRWREWSEMLYICAFMTTILFIVPLIGRKGSHLSYTEKLREYDRREETRAPTVVVSLVRSTLGRRLSMIWIWGWFAITVSNNAGRFGAMWKQEFLVPASTPDSVVLSSFGENMIVAPFDRKTKVVERSFSMLKKGEDPKLILRWEVVGPLQLKK